MSSFTFTKVLTYECSDEKVFKAVSFLMCGKSIPFKKQLMKTGSVVVRSEIIPFEVKEHEGSVGRTEIVHLENHEPKVEQDIIVGIDPGFTGAIAFLYPNNILKVHDLPIQRLHNKRQIHCKQLVQLIRPILNRIKYVVIENVHAMPEQGVSSTFKFGYNAGILLGVVEAMGLTTFKVSPGAWKPALNLSKDKKKSLALAKKLFPKNKIDFKLVKHDGRAEAALIAWHAKESL